MRLAAAVFLGHLVAPVVVMVRGHYEVRGFGPNGAHLW